jgi:hypothetical protein
MLVNLFLSKKAIRQLAKESGIPASTLDYWYYERAREKSRSQATKKTKKKPMTRKPRDRELIVGDGQSMVRISRRARGHDVFGIRF